MQKNRSKKYSKEEIKFIKENYAGTRQSVEKIALTLDRTTASINKKIYNLCLGERKKVETCCEEEKLTQREEEVYKEFLSFHQNKYQFRYTLYTFVIAMLLIMFMRRMKTASSPEI